MGCGRVALSSLWPQPSHGGPGGRGHCLKYDAATKAVVSAPCSETSTVWHMREKKRPMEYELLSPEMQKFWDK